MCTRVEGKQSHNLLTVEKTPTIGDLMSCEDFSDLQKLLRVTAQVLRAVEHFNAKKGSNWNPPVSLTPQEIATAEMHWISYTLIQQKDFDALRNQFGLFLDDKGM